MRATMALAPVGSMHMSEKFEANVRRLEVMTKMLDPDSSYTFLE